MKPEAFTSSPHLATFPIRPHLVDACLGAVVGGEDYDAQALRGHRPDGVLAAAMVVAGLTAHMG